MKTQEKILFEDYKLIHNFMYDEPLKAWINEINYKNLFLADWNELMLLVEKIETIEDYRFDFEIRQSLCEIYDKDNQEDILQESGDNKIEVVYYTVVEFIKWYNLNK